MIGATGLSAWMISFIAWYCAIRAVPSVIVRAFMMPAVTVGLSYFE
jgi:hypothetical protein